MASSLDAIYAGTAEDAELARFFARVRLPNGVYKTTSAHRLDDVNAIVARLLPTGRALELMDVAVSWGRTTVEWSEQLELPHRIIAGDVAVAAKWTRLGFGNVLSNGAIVYADVLGREIDVLGGSLRSRLALPLLKLLGRTLPSRRFPLVDPRLVQSAQITLVEDDIFTPHPEFDRRFDAVRAANILNRAYFDEPRLRAGVVSLTRRVRRGGLLIVCRTEDGVNHGSVYEVGKRIEELARLGEGSEVHELVVGQVWNGEEA
jgi:hypothetical protein